MSSFASLSKEYGDGFAWWFGWGGRGCSFTDSSKLSSKLSHSGISFNLAQNILLPGGSLQDEEEEEEEYDDDGDDEDRGVNFYSTVLVQVHDLYVQYSAFCPCTECRKPASSGNSLEIINNCTCGRAFAHLHVSIFHLFPPPSTPLYTKNVPFSTGFDGFEVPPLSILPTHQMYQNVQGLKGLTANRACSVTWYLPHLPSLHPAPCLHHFHKEQQD